MHQTRRNETLKPFSFCQSITITTIQPLLFRVSERSSWSAAWRVDQNPHRPSGCLRWWPPPRRHRCRWSTATRRRYLATEPTEPLQFSSLYDSMLHMYCPGLPCLAGISMSIYIWYPPKIYHFWPTFLKSCGLGWYMSAIPSNPCSPTTPIANSQKRRFWGASIYIHIFFICLYLFIRLFIYLFIYLYIHLYMTYLYIYI